MHDVKDVIIFSPITTNSPSKDDWSARATCASPFMSVVLTRNSNFPFSIRLTGNNQL